MKKIKLYEIFAYLLFTVFLYTAVSKLMDFDLFQHNIDRSPLFPLAVRNIIPYVVIALELVCCISLLTKKTEIYGLLMCVILLVMFTTYILLIVTISPYIPCSCGGIIDKLSWKSHFVLNILLLVMAIYAYYKCFRPKTKQT